MIFCLLKIIKDLGIKIYNNYIFKYAIILTKSLTSNKEISFYVKNYIV